MTLDIEFGFFAEVTLITGEEVMKVTELHIRADNTVLYGCLTKSGDTRWYRGYELNLYESPSTKMGFYLNLEANDHKGTKEVKKVSRRNKGI